MKRLSLNAHRVQIERGKGGFFGKDWYPVGDQPVAPNEPIRYMAKFEGGKYVHENDFITTNESGRVISRFDDIRDNFAGNAWVDTLAPNAPGNYEVTVAATNMLTSDFPWATNPHFDRAYFDVVRDAPKIGELTKKPDGGAGWFDNLFPNFDYLKWGAVGAFILVIFLLIVT